MADAQTMFQFMHGLVLEHDRDTPREMEGAASAMEPGASSRLTKYLAAAWRGSKTLWSETKKWFIAAAIVGLVVGFFVTGFDWAVRWIWGWLTPHINMVTIVLFPTFGLLLSGLLLQYFTVDPETHDTDEVVKAYHERSGTHKFTSFPGKILAALATLGFGGSAGLEGPSIYAGGAIGTYIVRKARHTLGFTNEDMRALMLAGAAAGLSAAFRAPLTGIVFALEVPYRDDITRQPLIPSLVSSVTAYLVLIQFLGVEPLFYVKDMYSPLVLDFLYAIILGIIVGLLARVFVFLFHLVHRYSAKIPLPLWARTGLGGLAVGLFGLGSLMLFNEPIALGVGYGTISEFIAGTYTPEQAMALFALKGGATIATLACGASGGIFIPMIFLGADAGVILSKLLPGATGPLLPMVGMAAFLAAGYSTPLTAVVFVAESTGGAGYIIPGLIAAAVAFSVAGDVSISNNQRQRRETKLDRLMKLKVGDIMIRDVATVSARDSVEDFVTDHLPHTQHKSLPVVDATGSFVGMVALSDVVGVPHAKWGQTEIGEVMTADVRTIDRDAHVGDLVALMSENEIDRVPVVTREDPTQLVGIVSSTDVLALDETELLSPYRT